MRIGLITDLHYGDNTNYPKIGGEEYINSFGEYIKTHSEEIASRLKNYDLIVNLGDLFADKNADLDRQTYKEALNFLKSIGKPIINVIGNHELHNLDRSELAQLIERQMTYYSLDFGGLHHVVLDAKRETRPDPYFITEEQLAWLSNDLATTPLKSLVYVHHPLDDQNLDNNYYFRDKEDEALVKNRRDVRAILERSGKVLAVFSGHLHFYNAVEINNVKYITVPSLTENDGSGKPLMQYISVSPDNDGISFAIEKIDIG